MAKAYHTNKQAKKLALLTPKEKKARRLAKKHAGDVVSFQSDPGAGTRCWSTGSHCKRRKRNATAFLN